MSVDHKAAKEYAEMEISMGAAHGHYSDCKQCMLAAAYLELAAEVEALKMDAGRYRKLRERFDDCAASAYFKTGNTDADDWIEVGQNSGAGISLDIAVDAMKAPA